MTHACTLAPVPAIDPIHAAIDRHRTAYAAFQIAPADDNHADAIAASDDYDAASDALVATSCATRFGALALLEHLRWWLTDEAPFKAGHQPAYGAAEVRAADLTLFLGAEPSALPIPRAFPAGRVALPPSRYARPTPFTPPNERLPGEGEPWQAVMPVRPDTAHVRAPRFLDLAGETLAAAFIIGWGIVLTGIATLV